MAQHDVRRYMQFRDQHNRRWGCDIELRTGDRVGPAVAMGWRAPVMPPDRLIMAVGKNDPYSVRIDYDEWASESVMAHESYQRRRQEAALAIAAQGTVGSVLEANPPELRAMVGPPPTVPHIDVIRSCAAGNRWMLFFEGSMPEGAAEHFPHLLPGYEPEIVSGARRVSVGTLDPFGSPEPVVEPAEVYEWAYSGGFVTMPDGERFKGPKTEAIDKLKTEWPDHFEAVRASFEKITV